MREQNFCLFYEQAYILATENLGDKVAGMRLQDSDSCVQSCQDKLMLHVLVKIVVAEHVRCSVRDHEVYLFAAKHLLNILDGFLSSDISLDDCAALNGRHIKQIHRNYVGLLKKLLLAERLAQFLANHLTPAARGSAEVYDSLNIVFLGEDAELLVYLEELVAGACAVAFFLGLAVVNVAFVFGLFSHFQLFV